MILENHYPLTTTFVATALYATEPLKPYLALSCGQPSSPYGVLALVSSYFIWREFQNRLISLLFSLSGIGMVGVGLFPETAGKIHTIVSFIAFFFGGLSAIATYKLVKAPFAYLPVLMGMISLIALALLASKIFLRLGPGGSHRLCEGAWFHKESRGPQAARHK